MTSIAHRAAPGVAATTYQKAIEIRASKPRQRREPDVLPGAGAAPQHDLLGRAAGLELLPGGGILRTQHFTAAPGHLVPHPSPAAVPADSCHGVFPVATWLTQSLRCRGWPRSPPR